MEVTHQALESDGGHTPDMKEGQGRLLRPMGGTEGKHQAWVRDNIDTQNSREKRGNASDSVKGQGRRCSIEPPDPRERLK